jgi:subtilisin family serine protease
MNRTAGRREVSVGLLDGPVAEGLLAREPVRLGSGARWAAAHGSFVAAMLSAARDGAAPAICPRCTLLVRPIFVRDDGNRSAPPGELAAGIVDCVEAGAGVLNLSAALIDATARQAHVVRDALDLAMARGVLVVAAAGNQGRVGGASPVTSHPWVISVTALGLDGLPLAGANLGGSTVTRGLGAVGEQVTSLTPAGEPVVAGGTSVAAPFVTGAIALIRSAFPRAPAPAVRRSLTASVRRRRGVVPPMLDAVAAYQWMGDIYADE